MKHSKRYISTTVWVVWGALIVSQIILSFVLYSQDGLPALRYVGWIIWVLAFVFGWLPILTFRTKGGVSEGRSYVHTTVLVDSGIYAIVRHPQYLAFVLVSLALLLIAQHWLITTIGLVAMVLVYIGILPDADRDGVEKFGDDYKGYMQRVPRVNFVVGIIQLVRRRDSMRNGS